MHQSDPNAVVDPFANLDPVRRDLAYKKAAEKLREMRAQAPDVLENIKCELARRTMIRFTTHTMPEYEVNWHHEVVADALDDVLAGRCRRLIVMQPPQTGKSELISRRFPAYALGRKPDIRIGSASYNDDLATDMSRDVQKIMASPEYLQLFPGSHLAEGRDKEIRTTKQFQVVGRRGRYYAVGVGSGLSGKTVDIGIVDDPIKNRDEAESKVYRQRVWAWYVSTFLTRQFGDTGAIIIATTRWHVDDLVGRLQKLQAENPMAERWRVLAFEAVAEDPNKEYDPREPSPSDSMTGEPLWPQKYPIEELRQRRIVSGKYEWSSLYQQKPTPPGGKMFKRAWFADKMVAVAPKAAKRARGWDTAATEDDGDWTVGVRLAMADDLFYVEDVQRGQWSPAGVDSNMKISAKLDGPDVRVREEREGGSSGKTVIEARKRTLKGFDYNGVLVDSDKPARARPFRSQCEAGNVYLIQTGDPVRDQWITPYLDELCDFPTGSNDDQVDASSCAFNALLLEDDEDEGGYTW